MPKNAADKTSLMCLSIRTSEIINFPLFQNGKLFIFGVSKFRHITHISVLIAQIQCNFLDKDHRVGIIRNENYYFLCVCAWTLLVHVHKYW